MSNLSQPSSHISLVQGSAKLLFPSKVSYSSIILTDYCSTYLHDDVVTLPPQTTPIFGLVYTKCIYHTLLSADHLSEELELDKTARICEGESA